MIWKKIFRKVFLKNQDGRQQKKKEGNSEMKECIAYLDGEENWHVVPQEELIRCKDCKYSKPIDSEWLECQHDKRCMKENGFCSWAERK